VDALAIIHVFGFCACHNSQRGVRSIGQGSAGTVDADTDTADQVAHADQHSAPEQRISGVVVAARVRSVAADLSQFGREDNAHNDTVDGYNLTENDGDQILGADAWCLDTTTEDRSSSNEDSPVFQVSACVHMYTQLLQRRFIPCSANDGEADAEADSGGCPGVGRYRFDERADLCIALSDTSLRSNVTRVSYVECLALAIKQHVCPSALASYSLAFHALEFQTYRVR
jgi:hypothetical protein